MYHVVKLSGKFYAVEITYMSNRDIFERIEEFLTSGTPSIIINDLSQLDELAEDYEVEIIELEN